MSRAMRCLAFLAAGAAAQEEPYLPSLPNLRAREWFQDARFGLFIHWGVYSVAGEGEGVMHRRRMTSEDYGKLAARFDPAAYDPAGWVALAKRAGMKYVTVTSKHHDGFAMWDSKVSDWDVVDRTPCKRDVLKPLADECRKQGLKLFFHHSLLDWHHPDYYPRGRTGEHSGRPEGGDFGKYLEFLDAQVAELCSGRFGEIAGIWFDGWRDRLDGEGSTKARVDWRLRRTYNLVHRLQPQALVGNNHHVPPFPGEDFRTTGKDQPGGTPGTPPAPGTLPLEICGTIGGSWGYDAGDREFKTVPQLVHALVRAAGRGANFLLNVGPMPDGRIPPEFVDRLEAMGQWLERHGESIYGTRAGPVAPQDWGVTTRKEAAVYVHVLDPQAAPADGIVLAGLEPGKVKSARLLRGGAEVPLAPGRNVLQLPPRESLDPVDTVIVLELAP